MKQRTKQIMAWIIIAILVLMYIMTLVFALLKTSWWQDAFRVAVVTTILLPICFYLIIFFTRMLTPGKTPDVSAPKDTQDNDEGEATEE